MKNNKLNLKQTCDILGKSKRTITRYIKKGLLNPERVKSEKGILEYHFDRSEVENLKKPNDTGQTTGQKQKVDKKNNDNMAVVKILEKQLKEKDRQIKQLLERQRETNYLLKGLQDRVLMLEDKSKGKRPDKRHRTEDTTSDKIKGFFGRLFRGQ